MRKSVYFDVFDRRGWPSPSELQHYFLAPPGRRWTFETRNECWGLKAEGVDGTEHLPADKGRIDINLTMVGNPDHGVLLQYRKQGGGFKDIYYSKGDLDRLREWVATMHGDLLPIGLYIPFDRAWLAVKEFIEKDGALPESIGWIADADVPDDAYPDPAARFSNTWYNGPVSR
jgi:Immunity protein Imm1